ncbi:MAG: YicC/YloC family endoribonuclease [Hyphomicrobiales bacterium]
MSLQSMTGYSSQDGTIEIESTSFQWTWNIRSVNGKSLDIRLRLPPFLNELDQVARRIFPEKLSRGNIHANLQLETTRNDGALSVNEEILEAVLTLSKKLSLEHDVPPISMDALLSTRGVLDTNNNDDVLEDKTGLVDAVLKDLDRTLDLLVASRASEGAALHTILEETLNEIEKLVVAARDAPERTASSIGAKFEEQIKQLMKGDHEFSEERLYQEALIMAAKVDIKEEIDRLVAHVASARELLASSEPVGRRLDFLTQEFNREANTVCSKANDIAITNIGLALKATIEQFREQVQNVE